MTAVRTFSWLLSLLAGLTQSPAAAEPLIVLKSNADNWRAGTMIDGATVLTLAEGQQLIVLSESGKEMTIAGPYSAAPLPAKLAPSGQSLLDSLSPLFTGTSKDETVIGAFRAPDEDRETLAWTIDAAVLAERSRIVCRDGDEILRLGRPEDVGSTTVLLERLGSALRAEIIFSGDASAVPWPDVVPTDDRIRYRLTTHNEASEFAIALLPAGLPTPAHRAAWMADHGCSLQARRLIILSY
jgi:hypothetical protein